MKATKLRIRSLVAILLSGILSLISIACGEPTKAPTVPVAPSVFGSLQDELQKSYLELFKISPTLHYSPAQFQEMKGYLDQAEDYCKGEFKGRADQVDSRIKELKSQSHDANSRREEGERKALQCQLRNLKIRESQDHVLEDHAIPIAYQNKEAKLELIQQWPSDQAQIKQEIADGSYHDRRWGDVKDIGFRQIAPGQKDDIKTGEEAIQQMKQSGLMPPTVQDPEVVDYVKEVANKVATHSDLHVPLHITVLNSKEINAFSLPGGYVFVERGLLEAADDEAELAGVLGHEMGHVVARHGHKLMERATVAGIVYQAAQVAAIVLTGGVVGIGTYYALQYGFYGLGLVMDLKLLGVSREYELQADQLGIQYAWNSGYDPSGFIRFFDKMATREGYVNGLGWFMDHPPFYERMVDAEREIMFLPKKKHYIMQTGAFKQMKKELTKVTAKAKEEEKGRPSLLEPVHGCGAPPKPEYKAGEPIEKLCQLPAGKTRKGH